MSGNPDIPGVGLFKYYQLRVGAVARAFRSARSRWGRGEVTGVHLDAAAEAGGDERGVQPLCGAQTGEQSGDQVLVQGADELGGAGGELGERAVSQHDGAGGTVGLVAEVLEHLCCGGQRPFRAEPTQTPLPPHVLAKLAAGFGGDPHGGLLCRFAGFGGEHSSGEHFGEQRVAAFGHADLPLARRQGVRLRCPTRATTARGDQVVGVEQADVDELIQVEGGKLVRDPDCRGGLLPGDWATLAADKAVQLRARGVV